MNNIHEHDTAAPGLTSPARSCSGTGDHSSTGDTSGTEGDDATDDISLAHRLEHLVQQRTVELSDLATYLRREHEEEKRIIARELHDELGSLLTAAKLDVTFIKSRCASSSPELIAKCERVAAMIDQGTALKRRVIDQLRPSILDLLGLGPALRELADEFAARTDITADVELNNDLALGAEPALSIYRFIEEALSNVRKHAQATRVSVVIERHGEALQLGVRDNGCGFDVENMRRPGKGLAAMRHRITAMGGRMSIDATPGSGMSIRADIPMAMIESV